MFDQTILMRILSLLARSNTEISVFLYCCDGNCLGKTDFMQGDSGKVQLRSHDCQSAGEAWTLFIRKDADGIMRLLEREPFERLPKMKNALLRCIDEFPDRNGLYIMGNVTMKSFYVSVDGATGKERNEQIGGH